MRRKRVWFSAVGLSVLLTLFGASVRPQTESQYHDLPNFHQVNAQLYRGGQPQPGGLAHLKQMGIKTKIDEKIITEYSEAHLKQMGIKTIINLRQPDARTQSEEREAHELGLNYYNEPLPGLSRPDDATVARVLNLINDPKLQPVFVHCKRGADRTGTIIACYRITHDHWAAPAAITEARRFGMSWVERGMKNYVNNYAHEHAPARQTPAAATPAQSISRLRALIAPAFAWQQG
jgi:tyrosine-protein phosphatase SIW14